MRRIFQFTALLALVVVLKPVYAGNEFSSRQTETTSEARICVQAPGYDCWGESLYSDCLINNRTHASWGQCVPVGRPDQWGNLHCRCQ